MSYTPFFLVVSGSRSFSNAAVVCYHLQAALSKQPGLVIICGGCRGLDRLAMAWAARHQVPCLVVAAQWQRYGRAAGPRRNAFMLSMAQGLLAFPLPGGRGTQGTIAMASRLGLPIRVVQ